MKILKWAIALCVIAVAFPFFVGGFAFAVFSSGFDCGKMAYVDLYNWMSR